MSICLMLIKLQIIGLFVCSYPLAKPYASCLTIIWTTLSYRPHYRFCFKLHRWYWADGFLKQYRLTWLFHQQQTLLNNLKEYMLSMYLTLIEQNDLFIGNAIFINKPDLAIFRYKTEYDILHHNIKIKVPDVYWFIFYK